jgi:hypothetical protein
MFVVTFTQGTKQICSELNEYEEIQIGGGV